MRIENPTPAFAAAFDADLAFELLEQLEQAVVVTDRSFDRIIYVNASGRAVLEALGGSDALVALRELAFEGSTDAGQLSTAVAACGRDQRKYYVRFKWLPPDHCRCLFVISPAVLRRADLPGVLKQHFGLTRRESQVVQLVHAGHRNDEIARQLRLTTGTVKQYLNSIFACVNVRSRGELSALVDRLGSHADC